MSTLRIGLVTALTLLGLAIAGVAIAGSNPATDEPAAAPAASAENDDEGRETPDDDAGEPANLTGAKAERAAAVALEAAGGGTVTEVERADEGNTGYEIEVRKQNGSFVEVAVDPDFKVTSVENDDD